MKMSVYFINIGRSKSVVTGDLVQALDSCLHQTSLLYRMSAQILMWK